MGDECKHGQGKKKAIDDPFWNVDPIFIQTKINRTSRSLFTARIHACMRSSFRGASRDTRWRAVLRLDETMYTILHWLLKELGNDGLRDSGFDRPQLGALVGHLIKLHGVILHMLVYKRAHLQLHQRCFISRLRDRHTHSSFKVITHTTRLRGARVGTSGPWIAAFSVVKEK